MPDSPLRITDTVLRDAHQSLLATRMRTEDMLPIAADLDRVGFHSLEAWGGATFDSTLRFLNEDPWERLRQLRAVIRKTPLQMLLRGQNLVGYRHYADDVVERFVTKAKENGIDIFRIFDALNDIRNIEKAVSVAKKVGGHVQATISYTLSPVHSNAGFIALAKQMESLGADSICIKDMAGLLSPYDAYDLVKGLKNTLSIPVQLHSHYTSGMASSTYLKAIEAGVDIIDTSISSLALGSSQPATETMVAIMRGQPRDTGLNLELLSNIAEHFARVRKKYGEYESHLVGVDTDVLIYQVPGGMISNLTSQLRQQNAMDKLPQVLEEIPRVRADLGYPPLVTPTSQIVGAQASVNVLTGQRYKVVSNEVKNYFRNQYGRPPGAINDEVKRTAIGDEEPIQVRPADLLQPEMGKAAAELGDIAKSEEDVLSYAIFPQVALAYFKERDSGESKLEIIAAIAAAVVARAEEAASAEGIATGPALSPWKLSSRPWPRRPGAWR